jgi:hypothetical protein
MELGLRPTGVDAEWIAFFGGNYMARVSRMVIQNQTTTYYIMSRRALDGYPLEDVEKDYWVRLM